jgi:serine/threonine protein kinase
MKQSIYLYKIYFNISMKEKPAPNEKKTKRIEKISFSTSLNTDLRQVVILLYSIDPEISKYVDDFFTKELKKGGLEENIFLSGVDKSLKNIAEKLRADNWEKNHASALIKAYIKEFTESNNINYENVFIWMTNHYNDSDKVIACMEIIPPKDIKIIKALPNIGSQKKVFEATLRKTKIVLKTFSEEFEDNEKNSNPLYNEHPNIIKTYILSNANGKNFIVEDYISKILNDTWKSEGVYDAANFLFEMVGALNFLHSKGLVHGDIKPDNIGVHENKYILMDFGISRPTQDFVTKNYATGSLRTRAPELIINENYTGGDPAKSDIWALGATIYKGVVGRFPLYLDKDEKPPRGSDPSNRSKFITTLQDRINNNWDKLIDFESTPPVLREILKNMLAKDPSNRLSAKKLIKMISEKLSEFIRNDISQNSFRTIDQVRQIIEYVNDDDIDLMPNNIKMDLNTFLSKAKKEFEDDENLIKKIDKILVLLS